MAHPKLGLRVSKTSSLHVLPVFHYLSLPDQPPSPFHLPPPWDPLQAAFLPEVIPLPDHTTALISSFIPDRFA